MSVKDALVEDMAMKIQVLMIRVFRKDKEQAAELVALCNKMMDDEEYIADKVFVFPGKNIEAEELLKEGLEIIFNRRI